MNRRILLPVALVVVLLLGAWYALAWKPGQNHLRSARAALVAAQAQQAQLDSQLGSLRQLQRGLPTDEAALARAIPAMPVSPNVAAVIDQIAQAARSTDVAWSNESQSVATSTTSGTATTAPAGAASGAVGTGAASAPTVGLTLQVAGSYQHVTAFVTLLTQRARLIVVDSLAYTPSASSVSATISARAFYDPAPSPDLARLALKS